MKLIDGKQISTKIKNEIAQEIANLQKISTKKPGLAVVLVGVDPASQIYVKSKEKACIAAGIYSEVHKLEKDTKEEELIALIEQLNNSDKINGILVQMPLPKHLDENKIINLIKPEKDVDGFHPQNVGKMLIGEGDPFIPCTPLGIQMMLKECGISPQGKHVVVIGRSNIVGKPIASLLLQKGNYANATVTICHSRTTNLKEIVKTADIIIAAIGIPNFVTSDMVKDGAVVIDVGINRVDDPTQEKGYIVCGDVDFEAVKDKCSFITPVPGGVGTMTIAMLLYNTLKAFKQANNL